MLGLAAAAEPFVRLILTEKWIDCVPLLQIFCIIFLFQPVHTANTQAIKAIGRSDITLKLEFIKKCIEIVTLLCVMWISVEAIITQIILGLFIYSFLSNLFKVEEFFYIKRLLSEFVSKIKK